jgi:hypothetical protein
MQALQCVSKRSTMGEKVRNPTMMEPQATRARERAEAHFTSHRLLLDKQLVGIWWRSPCVTHFIMHNAGNSSATPLRITRIRNLPVFAKPKGFLSHL